MSYIKWVELIDRKQLQPRTVSLAIDTTKSLYITKISTDHEKIINNLRPQI